MARFSTDRAEENLVEIGGKELAGPGSPTWVDCVPTPENLAWLAERFGFHPLALEDCAHEGQRSKFEDYSNALFVVLHRFERSPGTFYYVQHEIHAFLTKETLVTVHLDPLAEIDRIFDRCSIDNDLLKRGVDYLLYLILDSITDAHFAIADELSDEIEEISREVIAKNGDTTRARNSRRGSRSGREGKMMARILSARQSHAILRRQLAPQREVFGALSRPGDPRIKDQTTFYFRDVHDHLLRITEEIDVGRDLLASAMDIHLSFVNNRLGAIMTRLTLISTIFLPLTFMTGFFGMNLEIVSAPIGKIIVYAALALLPPGMLIWFRHKNWV